MNETTEMTQEKQARRSSDEDKEDCQMTEKQKEGFSVTNWLSGATGLVYAIIGGFAAVLTLGIFCSGLANTRAGIVVGQTWQSGVEGGRDIYRGVAGLEPDAPVNAKDVWEKAIGKRIPDVTFGQTPGETVTTSPPVEMPAPVVTAPTTSSEGDTERVSEINQALLDAQSQWNATADYQALLDTIAAIDSQIQPGEVYGLRDRLFTEASEFRTAVEAILPDYDALKSGGANPADPIERLRLAQKLQGDSDVILNFLNTHGLVNHPILPTANAVKKSAEQVIAIIKAAADASASATPEDYWNVAVSGWTDTTWVIVEYDDRIGSCNCAKLRALSPGTVAGVEIDVPSTMLNEHFPDQTGPLTEEIGQTIVFEP